jgi:hypothetical protein
MELMEPTTYILSPHSTELQSPEKWKDGSGVKDFLSATQYQSLEQLKNVSFPVLDNRGYSANQEQARFPSQGTTCKMFQGSCFLCYNRSRYALGYSVASVDSILITTVHLSWSSTGLNEMYMSRDS